MIFYSYTWSIFNNQMEIIFPYVSDIGTLPPQAALFSQLFDVIAVLCKKNFFFGNVFKNGFNFCQFLLLLTTDQNSLPTTFLKKRQQKRNAVKVQPVIITGWFI